MKKIGEKERPTQNAALSARSCLGYRFFFSFAVRCVCGGGGRRSFLFLSLSYKVKRSGERGPSSHHFISHFFLWNLFSLDVLCACWFCHRKTLCASECRRPTKTKRKGVAFPLRAGRKRKSQTFIIISLCIIDFICVIPLDSSGDKREREILFL